MAKPRRTSAPPKRSAHTFSPSPSLAQSLPADADQQQIWTMAARTWKHDPAGHLAFNQPTCTAAPACHELALTWSRCRKGCKRVIARCPNHNSTNPMMAAKAAHEAACVS